MLKAENSAEAAEVIQKLVEVKSAINITENNIDTLFDAIIIKPAQSSKYKPVCNSCTSRIKCAAHAKGGRDFDASIWRELWNGDNFRSNHTTQ